MHYEVVFPGGDLLGIFPSYGAAVARSRPWWDRGVRVRIRRCLGTLAPSALTMSAAARRLKKKETDEGCLCGDARE